LSADEFFEDLARFKYVKRLLNRYENKGDLQERLIVNHLISIYNVFDIDAANEMVFFKCDKKTWSALKSFLVFLNYLPYDVMTEISCDKDVELKLQNL
jgi:hypothetical protein